MINFLHKAKIASFLLGCFGLLLIAGFLYFFGDISETQLTSFIMVSIAGFTLTPITHSMEQELIREEQKQKQNQREKKKKVDTQKEKTTEPIERHGNEFIVNLLQIFRIGFALVGILGIGTLLYSGFLSRDNIVKWMLELYVWLLIIFSPISLSLVYFTGKLIADLEKR